MLIAVFFAGLRHGFDLDHIAAITDITSSQVERRRAIVLGTVYAAGHAVMLLFLGGIAVMAGQRIPETLDEAMGRVIGATLIALGVYVVYSLLRYGRDVRLRSRWMLVLSGLKRTVAWLRRTHVHPHSHVVVAPADPFTEYGIATCFGIGMIHGVGAETPSQVVLFTTAAGVTGALGGVWVLLAFVVGLLIGNTILVAASAAGFSSGQRLPSIYMVLAVMTALVSLGVGTLYVAGRADLLPSFLGG